MNPTLRDTFVLLDHRLGAEKQGWWPSVVISVEPIVSADKIAFTITRETLPDPDLPRAVALLLGLQERRWKSRQRLRMVVSFPEGS